MTPSITELREEIYNLEAELKVAYEHLALAESFIPEESWEDYEEMYNK